MIDNTKFIDNELGFTYELIGELSFKVTCKLDKIFDNLLVEDFIESVSNKKASIDGFLYTGNETIIFYGFLKEMKKWAKSKKINL